MSEARILVVRLGALGDVLLALPALRLLRRSLPDARIAWLVERRHSAALVGSPDLDLRFVASADAWRRRPLAPGTWGAVRGLAGALRHERFDVALDLQGLVKSSVWAWLSGARHRVGLPRGRTREPLSGLLHTRRAPAPRSSSHVTDLYLAAAGEAVRAVGATPAPPAPDDETGLVWLAPEEERWAERELAARGLDRFAVVNPGAAWVTKRWPPERYGELARMLVDERGLGVFVAHGQGEEALARSVIEAAGSRRVVTFPTDIRQLAAVLARAELFVGGDTGPYHLARVMGTRTVGLFGPTDPGRNGPRSDGDAVLWGRVACSPCYGRRCPTAIECMTSLGVEPVFRRADAVLPPA